MMHAHRVVVRLVNTVRTTVCDACSNDAFDATTGVDGGKPESVVNLTGKQRAACWRLRMRFWLPAASCCGAPSPHRCAALLRPHRTDLVK